MILKELMEAEAERVRDTEAEAGRVWDTEEIKPCDYFSFITGTGIGG